MKRSWPAASILALAVVACDHTQPFEPGSETVDVGPISGASPYRLTFNRGGDVDPSITGDRIVFSRRPIPQDDSDWCIAFLPLQGGTLLERSSCPDDGAANGTKEAWLQPTVSPNGERMAFVVETGSTSQFNLSPTFRKLVVGSPDDPAGALEILDVTIGLFNIQGPFGLIPANSIHQLQWLDDENLLFIAGTQKNLAGQFCCDTLYVPLAAISVNATTGTWERLNLGPLPPSDVTATPSGEIIFTQAEDPAFDVPFLDCLVEAPVCPQNDVMALAPGGALRLVANFDPVGSVARVVAAAGSLFALDEGGALYSVDIGSGQITLLDSLAPLPIIDLAIDATGAVLVALVDPLVTPSNLWHLTLP